MKNIDQKRKDRITRIAVPILFAVYMIVLLRLTVFRPGFLTNPLMSGEINSTFFQNYVRMYGNGARFSIIYLFVGNIVWFIPWGAFMKAYLGKSASFSIISGLVLSLIIETLQYVFGTGVSELDDLILNTSGAAIGCLCGTLLLKMFPSLETQRDLVTKSV